MFEKTHKEPDFREEDQILIGKYAVDFRLTEEFSRKHPVFLVSLVKNYHQKGEDKLPSRNKSHTLQEIVEVEDSPGAVKKKMKARKIRSNGKDHRQYLVRFKSQKYDKDKCLEEHATPDEDLYLRRFRASGRAEESHK
ncbi:hypothetical protein O181_035135 [Austropuccinia psidii MF-1]|uniref:Uncharacterized protein n=1 Tax=Austropuccinia psidii MF-1 TaxID=1389203 RepID=A0A9Q3D476_9BASI|nr:hypothetical protein [Austropuccinia psidii MF-1]